MNSNSKLKGIITLFLCLIFFIPSTQAHSPDQSYLYLRIYKEAIGGRFEMTAKDMNKALGLGLEGKMTIENLTPHLPRVKEYLISRSAFRAGSETYTVKFTETTVLDLDEMEGFARINFDLEGVTVIPDEMQIDYEVLFDKDKKHKGMLIIEYNWKAGIVDNEALFSNIYGVNDTKQTLSLKDASIWKGFYALVKLGVWHIWIGLDHILFIFALILPAVVLRRKKDEAGFYKPKLGSSWAPKESFKKSFFYILKIITFFTIAHSITLAVASLGLFTPPSWLVEAIIALSIALAAFHNIVPVFKAKEWMIAFGFGLFHGFGFASVLGEKGLSGDYMVLSLLGFNVGVELGQVLIICMIFPFLFLLRKQKIYSSIITYGSIVLIFISFYWFIERAFGVDLTLGTYFWNFYNGIFGG
ncbi:MAG: hypothetical protein ACI94Y_001728 [Maribacter sp.]|jgi:hypothetical protein